MAVQFQVSQRFGGGVYASRAEAEAVVQSKLGADDYVLRSDVIEMEEGRPVFLSEPVAEHNMLAMYEVLKKLNRKAAKLGLPAIEVVTGEHSVKVVEKVTEDGERYKVKVPMVHVRIVGQEIKLVGDWEFFGSVKEEGGAVLVGTVPGKEMPVQYREWSNVCDHCRQKRVRKAYYVFKGEGGFQRVGSTCLKDFMGHGAAQALFLASLDKTLREGGDSWGDGSGGGEPVYGLWTVLTMAAAVIRKHKGFVSRGAAQKYAEKSDGQQLPVTSELVATQFAKKLPKGVERIKLEEVDRRVAQKAVKWFKAEVAGKAVLSDYEHNLQALLGAKFLKAKRFGLVVSLVGVYLRKMGELTQKAARVNAHVGEVGQRRNFKGTFVSQNSFESQWGVTTFTRFATDEGQVTVKSSGKWWNADLEKGAVVEFKATIQKHTEWKEFKETVVNRAVELSYTAPQQEAA